MVRFSIIKWSIFHLTNTIETGNANLTCKNIDFIAKSFKIKPELLFSEETAKMAKKLQKQGMSEEEALAKAQAEVAAEAPAVPAEPPKPTSEELLAEIRDLLAARGSDSGKGAE